MEFALLVPVFLLLMLGTMQFGWVLFVRHELYAAAQQVCRQLALGADTAASANIALQQEMARLGANGALRIIAPSANEDAVVEIRVPLSQLLWTDLFRPVAEGREIHIRVVYRSHVRTG